MNKKVIKEILYPCEKLKGKARLVLTYHKITDDYEVIEAFDCNDRRKCGVEIPSQNGRGWHNDWDSCPLYLECNKKK